MCLFDSRCFDNVERNLEHMKKEYCFVLPDREYLKDLDGMLRYLGNKVTEWNQCLFCNRSFGTFEGVRLHMIDKGHTMLGTSNGMESEYEGFYDYTSSMLEIPGLAPVAASIPKAEDDDDDWEDDDEDQADESMAIETIESAFARYGLKPMQIQDDGSLRLPDGRTAGHRELEYVYKQRLGPETTLALAQEIRAGTLRNQMANKRNFEFGTTDKKQIKLAKAARTHHHRRRANQRMRLGVKSNELERIVQRVLL
eukprot:Selendium_serpulae@DN5733_c0_g2_i3.p1